ncbi:MAG TPA: hypothetical protein VF407_03990, partial [Polyangiaceae bacterium]
MMRSLPAWIALPALALACTSTDGQPACKDGTARITLKNTAGATLYVHLTGTGTDQTITVDAGETENALVATGHVVIDASLSPDGKDLYLEDAVDLDCGTTIEEDLGGSSIAVVGIRLQGSGSGRVVSIPAGIDCTTGSATGCSASFPTTQPIALYTYPSPGSYAAGISGCAGPGSSTVSCTINPLNGDYEVEFDSNGANVDVQIPDYTSGFVTSDPPGIDCGAEDNIAGHVTCGATFAIGTQVTFAATPGPNESFLGFRFPGCTPGASTCTITATDRLQIVGADFGVGDGTIDVTMSGTGTGTVSYQALSSLGPVSTCASPCTPTAPYGSQVRFFAKA